MLRERGEGYKERRRNGSGRERKEEGEKKSERRRERERRLVPPIQVSKNRYEILQLIIMGPNAVTEILKVILQIYR